MEMQFSPAGTPINRLRSAARKLACADQVPLHIAQNQTAVSDCGLQWDRMMHDVWTLKDDVLRNKRNFEIDVTPCIGAQVSHVSVGQGLLELGYPKDARVINMKVHRSVNWPGGRENANKVKPTILYRIVFSPGVSAEGISTQRVKEGLEGEDLLRVLYKGTLSAWCRWAVREAEPLLKWIGHDMVDSASSECRYQLLRKHGVNDYEDLIATGWVANDLVAQGIEALQCSSGILIVFIDNYLDRCESVVIDESKWAVIAEKLTTLPYTEDLQAKRFQVIREMSGLVPV